MRLLIDVSLSPAWVDVLRAAGLDAVHWAAVGRANAPDAEIMQYALDHRFAIMTHDLDFSSILFQNGALQPSVIQLRASDVNPHAIGAQVITELRLSLDELLAGAVVTMDLKRTRLRVLPFRRDQA